MLTPLDAGTIRKTISSMWTHAIHPSRIESGTTIDEALEDFCASLHGNVYFAAGVVSFPYPTLQENNRGGLLRFGSVPVLTELGKEALSIIESGYVWSSVSSRDNCATVRFYENALTIRSETNQGVSDVYFEMFKGINDPYVLDELLPLMTEYRLAATYDVENKVWRR